MLNSKHIRCCHTRRFFIIGISQTLSFTSEKGRWKWQKRNAISASIKTVLVTFPQNNVRFIAVNSGVDSANQSDNEFAPFLNIINEFYVKDGSKKVRASLKLKGESGEHLTTIPPYGYVKDAENSEQWIVDDEAAQVVKRIFALCMDGNGPTQIARILKEEPSADTYCLSGQAETESALCFARQSLWMERQHSIGHSGTDGVLRTYRKLQNAPTVLQDQKDH